MLKFKSMMTVSGLAMFIASSALADVTVRFDEGAPKDRFSFTNAGECKIGPGTIMLNLSGSAAGLIFDVTGSGAGVEVFQPLEFVSGASALTTKPTVKDGDNKLTLNFSGLEVGEKIAFTIDVDDTVEARGIIVSGSEISGATVSVKMQGSSNIGVFGQNAAVKVDTGDCAGA